jgi:hypothetical protein
MKIEAEKSQLDMDVVMPHLLSELKKKWIPRTKTENGYGYHGSSKGDEITYTLYFDVYSGNWTTKNMAFRGFVFNEIKKYI